MFSSHDLLADDIFEYNYFQLWQSSPTEKVRGRVYIKRNDPCIFVDNFKKDKTTRFCKLGTSGLDLERDYPSIYVVSPSLLLDSVTFYVAAPWNEQKCKFDILNSTIICEGTGN